MTLLWSGLVALAIGVMGGMVMSRNMLRRVEQVNRTAERVMAGDLSDRVPRAGTNDEFDQLAANLNGMLDQIERLMTAMREVTDNVAHDLKTPLARLRARLELALLGPQDGTAQSEAIRAAIEEADRLLATFNALLSIAEAEAGAGRRRGERLDVAARSSAPRSSCTNRWPRRRASRCGSTARPGRSSRATATCCRKRSRTCSTTRSNTAGRRRDRGRGAGGAAATR